jgi:hypothetical protein
MQKQSPLEALSAELGAVAGRIERETGLRVATIIAELKQQDSERELRFSRLEKQIADRLAELKDGRDGTSVTLEDVAPILETAITRAVEAMPKPKDGADGKDGRNGTDGKSVTVEELQPLIDEAASRAVSALPAPRDGVDGKDGQDGAPGKDGVDGTAGKDGAPGRDGIDGKDGAPGKDGADGLPGKDGADGKDGEAGKDGRDGKLPIVRAWEDRVYREGEVVTFEGGSYQATRDTGKQPSHEDWICLAAAGAKGKDGCSITIRGTYREGETYSELDQVALNGASFTAKKDNPGPCPGEGWQLSSSQGKRGQTGERGIKGDKGDKGDPSEGVIEMQISDDAEIAIVNADGSVVKADLYPLFSKVRA